MESFENILDRILAKYPEKTRDQVLQMVERRKGGAKGLLSDVGAISLVAQELLIQQDAFEGLGDQKINSAHAGLNDVTISGEVVDVSELREFPRQDGTTGKVMRVRLSDKSGQIDCAVWDVHAEQLTQEGVKLGARLRLEHGYTKHGRGGGVEFHLGNRGKFRLFDGPTELIDIGGQTLPFATIADIVRSPGTTLRSLKMCLRNIQTQRTDNGPVTALCEDQTGLVIAKFWDDKIEAVKQIGEGKTVVVGNPTIIERNGISYINVGRNSILTVDPDGQTFGQNSTSISGLKPDPMLHNLSGKIVERTEAREIETKEGRKVRVANVRIQDETGQVRVSLWDQHATRVEELRLGDTVKLIGVRVREGLNREVEASSVFLTSIEKTP